MSRKKRLLALIAAALAALSLGLAACGDDDDSANDTTTEAAPAATTAPATTAPATPTAPATTAAAQPTTLELEADPSGALAFTQKTLSAPAGDVTIQLVNPAPVPHNVGVEDTVSDTVQDGGDAEITVTLPAGSYEYFCDVPGHREAGMVGTLTVE